jgi:hypothetical protein
MVAEVKKHGSFIEKVICSRSEQGVQFMEDGELKST